MKNVLVTGGAGYVGSHACRALAEAGFRPITYDNLCLGHRRFVQWGPLLEGDIRDSSALVDAMRTYDVIGVMHFAAFAYVGESAVEPFKYYENNVMGTLSVLAAMRETGVKRIVFSSSCAVYGVSDGTPISERAQTAPINPYGRSKLACETMLDDFAAAYGLEPVILRYFNASGAEPQSGIGEDRKVETHLIPRAMMALRGHIPEFTVYGDDFPTRDGTAIRDYIHVSDLADAHVLALNYLLGGGERRTFNLGRGKGYSVREIIDEIAIVSGDQLRPIMAPRRIGDPPELVADPTQARLVLGFIPMRSELRTIVESAWQWHSIIHPKLAIGANRCSV